MEDYKKRKIKDIKLEILIRKIYKILKNERQKSRIKCNKKMPNFHKKRYQELNIL